MPPMLNANGKVSQSAFVLAFVKGDEIRRYADEGHPVRAIARHYDRSRLLVENAIALLQEFTKEIEAKDLHTVGRKVWKNRLGWEKSASFLEAKEYIDRGQIMPKEACGSKPRRRNRPAARGERVVEPTVPAPSVPLSIPAEVRPQPVAPVPPAAARPIEPTPRSLFDKEELP